MVAELFVFGDVHTTVHCQCGATVHWSRAPKAERVTVRCDQCRRILQQADDPYVWRDAWEAPE